MIVKGDGSMKKNNIFTFKFSDTSSDCNGITFHYTVFRKNLFNIPQKVATVSLVPEERVSISFSKHLTISEKEIVKKYFNDLVKLIIRPENSNVFNYTIQSRDSSNQLELVALVEAHDGHYIIHSIKSISPHQSEYLSRYFRTIVN